MRSTDFFFSNHMYYNNTYVESTPMGSAYSVPIVTTNNSPLFYFTTRHNIMFSCLVEVLFNILSTRCIFTYTIIARENIMLWSALPFASGRTDESETNDFKRGCNNTLVYLPQGRCGCKKSHTVMINIVAFR